MRNIFIDTGYFVALANVKDKYHNLAKEWAQQIKKDKIR
jgi:predicted nucleic acid-binding protein